MKRNIIKITLLICLVFPLNSVAQRISIKKLSLLQNSSLLEVQNYLDTNFWVLSRTVTLAETDSLFWEYRISKFIDSIKQMKPKSMSFKESSFNSKIIKIDRQTPLYFVYFPSNSDSVKDKLIPNDFTIRLPKQALFETIALGLEDYYGRTFHSSISISYKGSNIKDILQEISSFNIPKDSSFIEYGKETIQRVYKMKNQVITITTFSLDQSDNTLKTFEISIYSKSDYDFLNAAQYNLKGKVDFIQ